MIRKLLIVDDSPIARKITRKCLPDGRDFDIREAGNGQEGVDLYGQERPDCTFLDLTMPVMDGFEALARIMQQDPDALVIVCTADVQEKVLQRVANLGAFRVIKKPPSKENITRALELAEARQQGGADA